MSSECEAKLTGSTLVSSFVQCLVNLDKYLTHFSSIDCWGCGFFSWSCCCYRTEKGSQVETDVEEVVSCFFDLSNSRGISQGWFEVGDITQVQHRVLKFFQLIWIDFASRGVLLLQLVHGVLCLLDIIRV